MTHRSPLGSRRSIAALALLVAGFTAACASTSTPSPTSTPTTTTPTLWMAPRPDLGCTPVTPTAESDCARLGPDHHYRAPLFCSGIEREPDHTPISAVPCACSSNADIVKCASVP